MMDPHQAIDLTQRLSRAGVRTEKFDFTAASMGRLALALYQAIRNATLALPNDTDLLDELKHVRLRETSPGMLRLDHARTGTATARSRSRSLCTISSSATRAGSSRATSRVLASATG